MSLAVPPVPLAAVGAGLVLVALVAILRRNARRQAAVEGDDETPLPQAETLVEGFLTLRDGARFPAGVRLDGDLRVARDALVEGPLRVTGDATVDEGAVLEGVLEVDGDLLIAPGARVSWVRARGTMRLAEGATVTRGARCGRLHLVSARRNAPEVADV